MRKTKIVCTIGPASESPERIRQLLTAGMDIARLNFSHGTNEEHLQRLHNLRAASAEMGRNLGVLLDIQGPKIRLGHFKDRKVMLKAGETFTLTTDPIEGDATRSFVGYPSLPRDMKPGRIIYIDDGLLELEVQRVEGNEVITTVVVGGECGSRKGVTLPGVDVDLPAITPEDVEHIRFGVEHGVDFIAASFVRRGAHIQEVKDIMAEVGTCLPVIAKIESDEGLRNIDEIIEIADGIMVARGDLGVEIPPEEVPLAQKMMIKKCNDAGIPVITATQMLDSMARNPRPTRAEVTDVANAIFDGTDCVMLSGETAVGAYPVQAVKMMGRIAFRMERSMDYRQMLDEKRKVGPRSIADAISLATCQTAQDLGVKAILVRTQSGATAKFISRFRPEAPVLAVCPEEHVARQLSAVWGVYPVVAKAPRSIDEMIDVSVAAAKKWNLVHKGDIVTITAGVKSGVPGNTNLLQVHRIDEDL